MLSNASRQTSPKSSTFIREESYVFRQTFCKWNNVDYALLGPSNFLQSYCSHVKCSGSFLFILPAIQVLLDPGHRIKYKRENGDDLLFILWHGRLKENLKRETSGQEKGSARHDWEHQ